jgi:hypothetical protein
MSSSTSWVCSRSAWFSRHCSSPSSIMALAQGWPPSGAGRASLVRSAIQLAAKPSLKTAPGKPVE